MTNLDGYKSIWNHCIALYGNYNYMRYFDSFEVEYIPKEISTFVSKKNITANIYRIQASDLIQ